MEGFRNLCRKVSGAIGSPWAFIIALSGVTAWLLSGPIFHYSDTWQLVINTSTTIVTFLIVFLIQNTQNHDSRAIHLKLDELIRAVSEARTGLVELQDLPDTELKRLEGEFQRLRRNPQGSAS
ncbi:MAG TPA: low affinity iron permease family protein [Kofleriaceae bacterium]|nr:low affinity iron permease family protein [Kofleriaceae bacterium]